MTTASSLYGRSLYDLARDEGLDEAIFSEMEVVAELFRQQPEYPVLLSEPSIPKKERLSLLDQAFGDSLQPYLLNFLKILLERGMIRGYQECLRAYRDDYNRDHGIVDAYVTAAVSLGKRERDSLQKKLEGISGKKVILHERVDSGVLGGLRVEMGGKTLDGTVAGRLSVLEKGVKDVVL